MRHMPALLRRLGKSRTITLGSLGTAAGLILIPLGRFTLSQLALSTVGMLFFLGAVTFVLVVHSPSR